MDGADLELFERSLRHATEQHTGAALDAALDELGWREALADDPRAASRCCSSSRAPANATSSALDHVVAHALGLAGIARDRRRAAGHRPRRPAGRRSRR